MENETKAKRGRPSREATERRARKERIPFGSMKMKMDVDKQTLDRLESLNIVPRWINDENHGQRIKDAENGGYEFINAQGSEIVGSKKVDSDKRIKKLVGSHKDGSAKYAYLMGIHRDFYEEDKAFKEAENRKVDDSIRAGQPSGTSKLNISSDKASIYHDVNYKP